MPVQPMYFNTLSFQQANPILSGMQSASQTYGNDMQAQMTNLRNQLLSAQIPYASQAAAADLQLKQAQVPYTQAQTKYIGAETGAIPSEIYLRSAQAKDALANAGLTGQRSSILNQEAPYLVQQEQGKVFSDPTMNRLWQIQQAQKTGGISPDLLAKIGLIQPSSLGGNSEQNGNQQGGSQPLSFSSLPSLNGRNAGGINYPTADQVGQASPATSPKLFNGDPLQNFALFGSPYNPIQYKAMQDAATEQAKTGVDSWNAQQKDVDSTSDDATQMKNYVNQFKTAYGKSSYKGPLKGEAPSSGIMSGLVPGDLTPEQQADSAAQNMQALVLKLMHTNKLTNYELQFARNLKLNRSMTPDTVQQVGDFLTAKSDRLNEQQDFLNAARNNGLDVQTANRLWQTYNNQRPVYDFKSNQINKNFSGSWRDYLTPEAVNAARTGQQFVSIPSFKDKQQSKNWYNTLTPDVQAQVKNQMGGQ